MSGARGADISGSFGGALSGILIGATAGASDLYFPPMPGKRTETTIRLVTCMESYQLV